MNKWLLCGVVAVLAGCSNAERSGRGSEARTDMTPGDLVTSVEVEVGADAVRFVLHVTNASANPVGLEFPTAQRYDFVVRGSGGEEVWRWSAGQMFAQFMGEEVLEPNRTLDYQATWNAGNRSGSFTVVGRLTASNRQVQQQAQFAIPKR